MNITGRPRPAVTVNGSLPAPVLRWREGDTVTLRVSNQLADAPSSIHWHGIVLPSNMDGVPGLSFDGIAPGESWLYRFTLRQSGTYWYHSHSMFQEQAGLYGAIIVDPLQPPPYRYDREHVLLFSDWTDLDPSALFRRLKKAPSYDNYYKRTVADFARDAGQDGLRATLADRGMWGRMRMTPSDLSDVNAHTYTYLLNGLPPTGNWTGLFQPGEKVLLRLVNAGTMSYFDVRIPGLKMTVVAADGQYVHPVTVDELRLTAAETYDVIVEPSGQDAYTIFAHGHGPHRFRPRHAGRAPRPRRAGAGQRSAAAADHGRHGPRCAWPRGGAGRRLRRDDDGCRGWLWRRHAVRRPPMRMVPMPATAAAMQPWRSCIRTASAAIRWSTCSPRPPDRAWTIRGSGSATTAAMSSPMPTCAACSTILTAASPGAKCSCT